MCLQGIKVLVFIKTIIQFKMMNTATMISCRYISFGNQLFRIIHMAFRDTLCYPQSCAL